MSRAREFRAWNRKRKCMQTALTINEIREDAVDAESQNETWGWSLGAPYGNGEAFDMADGDLELMEYIGRKDNTGTKIFEGDILEDGAVVEYFDDLHWDSGGSAHPGFYCRKWFEYGEVGELSYHYGFDDCRVIGNKFQNPELVK